MAPKGVMDFGSCNVNFWCDTEWIITEQVIHR